MRQAREKNRLVRLTEELEVTLAADELVEAHIRLDGDAGAGVAVVGIAGRDDREAFALGLPREIAHGVYNKEI